MQGVYSLVFFILVCFVALPIGSVSNVDPISRKPADKEQNANMCNEATETSGTPQKSEIHQAWQAGMLLGELNRLQINIGQLAVEVQRLIAQFGTKPDPQVCPCCKKAASQAKENTANNHKKTRTTTSDTKPKCDANPSPLLGPAANSASPPSRACAATCMQLRDQGINTDGVYWLSALPVPVYCDLSNDRGGWTLLLTATSKPGWDSLAVLERNASSPSLDANYAILRYADTIRDLGTGDRFAYRIETQAQSGRRRWGGVWFAPRHYSFIHESSGQTDVSLMRLFDTWAYSSRGVQKRMPWLNTGARDITPILTTADTTGDWWGTLVTHHSITAHSHSPWMSTFSGESGTVLYWLRENVF